MSCWCRSRSPAKKRPAVVISSRAYNLARPDVVVMAITSQLRAAAGDVWVERWQEAGLLKPSAIKPVFATLEQALVIRKLGVLHANDQARLRHTIGETLA